MAKSVSVVKAAKAEKAAKAPTGRVEMASALMGSASLKPEILAAVRPSAPVAGISGKFVSVQKFGGHYAPVTLTLKDGQVVSVEVGVQDMWAIAEAGAIRTLRNSR